MMQALTDGSAQPPAERAEAAVTITNETRRLQRLLDDVRHLNRLGLTDSVRREHVGISTLCTQTAQRFRLAARDAGVTLTARVARARLDTDPRLRLSFRQKAADVAEFVVAGSASRMLTSSLGIMMLP